MNKVTEKNLILGHNVLISMDPKFSLFGFPYGGTNLFK